MTNLISINFDSPSHSPTDLQNRCTWNSDTIPPPTISGGSPSKHGLRKLICVAGSVALAACGGGGDGDLNATISATTVQSAEATVQSNAVEALEKVSAAQTQPQAINLALNKTARASSSESRLSPVSVVDGKLTTRWGSLFSDAQWISVDLGATTSLNHVVLNWQDAYGKAYEIQTSTDGNTWKTVYSTSAGVGGVEDIKFSSVSARYVKMNGLKRATGWGYSLYEFSVYNDPPANLALNRAASTSSVESASFPASAAFDGNGTSRWASVWNSDAQWISVDLGFPAAINHVALNWEYSYAKAYEIQVSSDGQTWNTVFTTSTSVGGNEDIRFNTVTARYVKMNGLKRAYSWGYSLFEFLVFNDNAVATPTPVPVPAPTPAPAPVPTTGTRDPLKQPFASNSIWNMPIGSGAQYVPANLAANPTGGNGAPAVDDERIVMKPTAPLTAINYSSAAWTGANRCSATGGTLVNLPIPTNYVVPNGIDNSSASFLAADGRTIIQSQPFTRCTAGGPATSLLTFPAVDLFGDGIRGSHGGSGLSAIGGSIRVGELRPGQQGMQHAIKINVGAPSLYACTTQATCYRWPANTADSYWSTRYGRGTGANNTNAAMKMGALLGIPATVNIANLGLETEPGKQLAWTLQNYGAYIVDTYMSGPAYAFNAENGPDGSLRAQFKADWGYDFEQWAGYASGAALPWTRDIQKLIQAVYVVDNNALGSVGGGGTPRQPLAPAIP